MRDIATFAGRTGQYVFISSASVYEKPVRHYMMTEKATKLENRYWEYSRNKIACEQLLRAQDKLPYTIVRPSHTVRTGMPIRSGCGDPPDDRRQARDRCRRWLIRMDADAVCRRCGAVGPPSRQFKGAERGFPHHHIAGSPGTRSTRRSLAGSASKLFTRMCRPQRWSATTTNGKAPLWVTRHGRPSSTTPRSRAWSDRSTHPKTSMKFSRTQSSTPGTIEEAICRKRRGQAHRPYNRSAGRCVSQRHDQQGARNSGSARRSSTRSLVLACVSQQGSREGDRVGCWWQILHRELAASCGSPDGLLQAEQNIVG
jgi:hypothetical protein